MKIFPQKQYQFRFLENKEVAWDNLKKNTKATHSIVSGKTDKEFIGVIESDYFKLISSVTGKGAFCIVEGDAYDTNTTGTIKVQVHRAFRILMVFWLIFVGGGMLFLLIATGPWVFIKASISLAMLISAIRFIALESLFNAISKNTLKKLVEVLNIEIVHS